MSPTPRWLAAAFLSLVLWPAFANGARPGHAAAATLPGRKVPTRDGSSRIATLNFGPRTDFTTGSQPYWVSISDLNGDGKPDLAVANFGSASVSILLGLGSGAFGAKTDFATGLQPRCVAVGDLNGDGKPDLAVTSHGSDPGTVGVLLGNGDGTFGVRTDYITGNSAAGVGSEPACVAIADLNADAKPDLAVVNGNSNINTLAVLPGHGDGTFGTRTEFGTGISCVRVAIGDLNGDGRPDAVVTNFNSSPATVSVFLGNGDGTFQPKVDYATGSKPFGVAIGDLNGDHKPDLVVTDSGSNAVSVLLGNGDGTFGARTDFTTGSSPYSAAIGDLDLDGIPDLAVANEGSSTVSILLGHGDGTFAPKVDLAVGNAPISVSIGDLDGDGRPDLAAANFVSGTVSVLLNASPQTEPQTCDSVKVECCALKPSYGDTAFAGFTGTVAAITYWSPNTSGPNGEVVGIVNFLNQGAAPIGAAGPWLTPKYYGPGGSWNKGNLGTVFGVTFDDLGNLYVASSSCYGSDFYPGGLAGRIWKIDASTGAYSQFNNLPNFPDPSISPGQNMPALGNIAFDCDHRQLFVTNFEDGKIYRLSMVANAAPLSTFDPGAPDPGVPGFAPLGERLWAVRYHAGRVYYSIWTEDAGRPNASLYNTVWSVALNGSGDFVVGSQRLELTLPHWTTHNFSNPVSDISFGPQGQMLMAERTMDNDTQPGAHESRLLEYVCEPSPVGGTQWVPSGNIYGIGALDSPIGSTPSSAGGCDYDLGIGSRVWVTADAIEFGPDYVYGLQGLPNTGGDVTNSIEVDDNNLYATQDKTEIGEIRISCQTKPQQPSELCGVKFNDLNGDGIRELGEPALSGWTIVASDGVNTYSTVTDASGSWCIENLPPGTYVVHEVPQPGWSQTAPASVTYTRTVPPGTAGLDFGNFQNCQQPSVITCTAGRVDSFATSDGPEPSSPSPALLTLLNGCSPGSAPLTMFDVIPCHQCFGHTFDKCWSDSCVVTGALLQIHLRAGDCTPQDDSLYFMNGGSAVWGIGLSTLENLATGGTDPTWSFGDDRVFTLDLANLPPDTYGVTNILAALQNGQLGVLVRDGTGVDFIRIRVTVCCPSGNLGGSKFLDLNHNGVWDSGEPTLSGWTIQLTGPVNATTTTNASGAWSFTGLPAGTYTVQEAAQPSWINTAPAGGSYTVALPAGGNITGLNFGNWPCQTDNPCARPPKGMVAWWPLDEAAGPHSDDVALNNVGTWQGAPVVIPGEVGNALHLATGSDYVQVPNSASLNFGTGDLSMDAWVRFAQPFSGVRSIVDKRGGTISAPVGYLFFTINDRLAFQLDDGTAFNYISGAPSLADGQWHHVAATVHRTSTTGGRLYVDGNVVLIFDPTNRPGSITNASALNLGQQVFAPAAFAGDLDEVEVFRGALDSTSVRAIWTAGPRGKCKERASLPAATTFCLGQTVAGATLTLCNSTVTAQTFTWTLAGLPPGGGCTIPGPTVFTPPAGTVTVPAGGCVNIPFTIQRPAGLVPGQIACYEVTVLDSLGHCFGAAGRLRAVDVICNILNDPTRLMLPFPATGAFEWSWTNPLQQTKDIPFQVVALDEDGNPDLEVALNGLPPGEPYLGVMHLVAGDTYDHLIRASVNPLEHDPFAFHTILLEADTDGDGQMEPLSSGTMVTVLPEDLPTGTPPDARAPLSGVRVQPNPFLGTTSVAFTLARATPVTVRVYDLLGRLVRSLEDAQLEPGAHFVTWDGRDQAGRDVGHGIYLVRVHAGDRIETAKVVRMR